MAAALERLRDGGHESAVVAPYLLNEGLIARRVRHEAVAAAERLGMRVAVAGHLGLHPAVLAYLRARARGARSGGAASALSATPLRPAGMRHPRPIVVAGCASGTGKSTLALGLMAALRARGLRVQPPEGHQDQAQRTDCGFHAVLPRRCWDAMNIS